MLSEISAKQLFEWFAFNAIEGFGERRADFRNGILASLIANVHRDAKRKPSAFRPIDFMQRTEDEKAKDQERELRMSLDRISTKAKRKD